eukprot:Nitzschia sp. Nitz4//scaffold138_size62050//27983//29107//NITZ4_006388-RA/size62050-processed-gene-0.46-mRNA-1//1//CDS//3329535767//6291//frame0
MQMKSQYYFQRRSSSSLLPLDCNDGDDSCSLYRYNQDRQSKNVMSLLIRWKFTIVYGLVFLYSMSSLNSTMKLRRYASSLQGELDALNTRQIETLQMIENANATKEDLSQTFHQLKKTQESLQHELRVQQEFRDLDISSEYKNIISGKIYERRRTTALTWMKQRHNALEQRVDSLQRYVAQQSRKRVIDKYGPGPHRVQFTVKTDGKEKKGKFLLELAPVDLVPHAIETFLDMVSNKIWDNTVFCSHYTRTHVVMGFPATYGTFESRQNQLDQVLGREGLGFHDYSDEFPHEELTIGFAGLSSNIFINMISNVERHGPGAQDHHALDTDADPVFGKITWGKNIVRQMLTGVSTVRHPRHYQDFDLTQILEARLM